jgi:hypothetical protein
VVAVVVVEAMAKPRQWRGCVRVRGAYPLLPGGFGVLSVAYMVHFRRLKYQKKNCHLHILLHANKLNSTKSNFLCGMCKNIKKTVLH